MVLQAIRQFCGSVFNSEQHRVAFANKIRAWSLLLWGVHATPLGERCSMPLKLMKKPTPISLRGLAVFLCASVFAWGLQAKLSLYHHEPPSHPNSVAKLIQDEQVNKKAGALKSTCRRSASLQEMDRAIAPGPQLLVTSRSRLLSKLAWADIPCCIHAHLLRSPPFDV